MKSKGKQIDYEAIIKAENKVNLGCKCNPKLKMELAQEAVKYGMTLSEYIEILVSNRDLTKNGDEEIKTLKSRLAFYENKKLIAIFRQNKGHKHSYTDSAGKKQQIEIRTIQDAYTIVLNSIEH